jgi:coenzyme F420-reducing hydrogenase delta subunit/Pyruvate/2-oxoacid:ferredoxin oxidoreductase delta subunit
MFLDNDMIITLRASPLEPDPANMPPHEPSPVPPLPGTRTLRRILARLDAWFDRLYGWRWNPLYQSGTIAVLMLVVLVVTGLYLLLYYRIGAPWASVERIQSQVWAGRWIRALHRYASDAAMIAIGVHAVRMFLRGRSWGPRALAWLSGLGLLALFFFIALTGFVMVWDVQGRLLAMEGARLLDALPIFTEPVSRAFTGERPMPGAFFFLNYFLHIAVPLGMALFLYLHVARVARPKLLPTRKVAWTFVGALTLLAVVRPAPLPPEADPSVIAYQVPLDWFFAFWVPVTQAMPAGAAWLLGVVLITLLVTVPIWTRPRAQNRAGPSVVEERHCTGCTQCSLDCPYEAITMIGRSDERLGLVASVDPALCVSCGICAGSCAPMSVGPAGRTGRDQLARVRGFLARHEPGPDRVVVVACSRGAGEIGELESFEGALVYPVDCIGSLHTSVVEFLVRGGAGGVLVAACPERDCWNREGTKWARARLFEEREAELKERVDRARVAFVQAGAGERAGLAEEVCAFAETVHSLRPPDRETTVEIDLDCDRPVAGSSAGRDGVGT